MDNLQVDPNTAPSGLVGLPGDLTDPDNQRKTAANVLTQLGLHPDQAGARNLLDLHFQGPTADPGVKQLITPPVAPPPEVASTSALPTTVASPSSTGSLPTITTNTQDRTLQDQSELNRLISSGSGISQIHNPFLRGLSRVGEIASDLITPNLTKDIPGTMAHHDMLIGGQKALINSDLANQAQEATTAHTAQKTTDLQKYLQQHLNQNRGSDESSHHIAESYVLLPF